MAVHRKTGWCEPRGNSSHLTAWCEVRSSKFEHCSTRQSTFQTRYLNLSKPQEDFRTFYYNFSSDKATGAAGAERVALAGVGTYRLNTSSSFRAMHRLTTEIRWHRLSGAADRRFLPGTALPRMLVGVRQSRKQTHNSSSTNGSSSGSRSLSSSRDGGSGRASGCGPGTAAAARNGNVSEAELQKFRHLKK